MNPIVTRRDFVQAAMAAGLGLTIYPVAASDATVGKAEHIIYVYLEGGMSHLDSLDPKDHPDIKGPFEAIQTKVPGLKLSEHFAGIGKHADQLAVLRGMQVQTGAHAEAQYQARTSFKKIGSIVHPNMGAWMSYIKDGDKIKEIPDNVLISGPSDHPGSGWLPKRYSPLPILDPAKGLESSIVADKVKFATRTDILNNLNKVNSSNAEVNAYREFYDATIKLLKSRELDTFDLSKENLTMKMAFGDNKFGQGCLLAKRLIQLAGTKFIEIRSGGWDMHTGLEIQGSKLMPQIDQGVSALINELTKLGLMSKTLIILATEFGRTPKINDGLGRDHHPGAFSCALIGAGIKGGTVHGVTDEKGDTVVEGKTTFADLNATIAAAAGLPITQRFISPEGRPFTIADKGTPISTILKV